MPSKSVRCADCGTMCVGGRGSLPEGQRRCRGCRRERPSNNHRHKTPARTCDTTYVCAWSACGRGFTRYVRKDRPDLPERCCSKSCMMKRRAELAGNRTDGERDAAGKLKASPEQLRAKNYRRRTARRIYDLTAADERAMRAQAKRCPLCNVKYVDGPFQSASKELDHIVPIAVGGTHTRGNTRILCRRCNQHRPKDGSDFAGQITLWSSDPDVIPSARVQPIRPCRCGTQRSRDPDTQRLLPRCRVCQATLDQRRASARTARPVRTITCPYCHVTVTTGYQRQTICGSKPCQTRRRYDNWQAWDERKRAEDPKHRVIRH